MKNNKSLDEYEAFIEKEAINIILKIIMLYIQLLWGRSQVMGIP